MAVTEPAVDSHGHLLDLRLWTPDVAAWLAEREGILLTRAHWEVIRLVQQFHRDTGVVPAMRPLVKLVREALGDGKGSSLHLLGLFPGSPARIVAKLAGLPRPSNCL